MASIGTDRHCSSKLTRYSLRCADLRYVGLVDAVVLACGAQVDVRSEDLRRRIHLQAREVDAPPTVVAA